MVAARQYYKNYNSCLGVFRIFVYSLAYLFIVKYGNYASTNIIVFLEQSLRTY